VVGCIAVACTVHTWLVALESCEVDRLCGREGGGRVVLYL